MLWHIGNTTVRTPYRLRDALLALEKSPLNGNLSGREQENAFAALLHHEGILDAPRVVSGKDASDLGRKWRVALSQLGFITPQLTRGTENGVADPALAPITKVGLLSVVINVKRNTWKVKSKNNSVPFDFKCLLVHTIAPIN